MKHTTRIWKDGDGHWVAVFDGGRREVSRTWLPGERRIAVQEGRDIVARLARDSQAAA